MSGGSQGQQKNGAETLSRCMCKDPCDAGKAIAEDIRKELAVDVAELVKATGKTPGLAVVLVGERTDSATYVRMKIKACEEVGANRKGVGRVAGRRWGSSES